MLRSALFFAFEHERDRQGQASGNRLPGPASLDEGHQLPFVVAGAARDDCFAARSEILDARLERRSLPQIERIDRLHIVMTIKQRARALAVTRLSDHDRMTGSRTHVHFEADGGKIL